MIFNEMLAFLMERLANSEESVVSVMCVLIAIFAINNVCLTACLTTIYSNPLLTAREMGYLATITCERFTARHFFGRFWG